MKDSDIYPTGDMNLPGEPTPSKSREAKHRKQFWIKSNKKKAALLIIASSVLFLGTALWFLSTNQSNDAPKSPTTQTENIQEQSATMEATDTPATIELKEHKSDNPRVQFMYPASWQVIENEDSIRLGSPTFIFSDISGQDINGYFRIYISQGANPTDAPYIGSGVAIKPSETLTYSSPAPGQRSETNLTNFGYDDAGHFAYFFIAGNYSLNPGETLGPNYGQEPGTYIIGGGYSSDDLADGLSMQRVPLDYYATTNAYNQAIEILRTLKVF